MRLLSKSAFGGCQRQTTPRGGDYSHEYGRTPLDNADRSCSIPLAQSVSQQSCQIRTDFHSHYFSIGSDGPTWAKLVRTLVDGFQCVADVVGQGVFGCERVASGVDLDGAVAAQGADEFLD